MTSPKEGRAIVKNVLSADTIVLRGKPVNGPPPERIISLANVTAPRLGSPKEPEKEEPFAFQSREYLRKLLIGKEVMFKVEYTTTTNKRDFGNVFIAPPGVEGETNVARLLVKNGWVRVKPAGKHQATEEQNLLNGLEGEAQAAKVGLWSGESGTRSVSADVPENPQDFVEKNKGKEIPAIVEQVRDGSTYRVLLMFPQNHRLITLQLSGLRCPTVRKDGPGTADLEPFGEEARYFVEARLLQREVTVILESFSNNNFIGSVKFPAGNIAEALLSDGFAKVVDWSLPLVTGGGANLRAAEMKAKQKRVRLWKDYVAKAKVNYNSFDAVVLKVLSADMIVVLVEGKERKLTLSSIRAPKPKDPKEAGYNYDAREFLRSKLIGKKVHVHIDYIKPAQEGYEERECATIKVGNLNIVEELISRGLAGLVKYKRDDDNRASFYDQLLLAEDKAMKEKLGIHSGVDKDVPTPIDASENITKARQYLPTLQRIGSLNGIVEFVSSGSRFKVYIPSQRIKLTLVLSGIRCPRVGRPGEPSEPFGQEALDYANRKILQRDVEIVIEALDKVGGFIGTVFLTGRHNFAVLLAQAGLAEVHEYSAKQTQYGRDIIAAGEEAKKNRKGIWSIKDPYAVDEIAEVETVEVTGTLPDAKDAVISEIVGGNSIYLQFVGDEIKQLEKLMADFANFHKNTSLPPYAPKMGEVVSAKYTADNQWYRARVRKINQEGDKKTYTVLYIDYGNTQTVTSERLRPLDSKFSTSVLQPQAQEAEFAYLAMPKLDQDYGEDLYDHLRELLDGKKLSVRVVGKVGGVLSVYVYLGKDNVNEMLVRDGLATVSKASLKRVAMMKRDGKQGPIGIDKLAEMQEEAKRNRAGMWRYGDCTEDD